MCVSEAPVSQTDRRKYSGSRRMNASVKASHPAVSGNAERVRCSRETRSNSSAACSAVIAGRGCSASSSAGTAMPVFEARSRRSQSPRLPSSGLPRTMPRRRVAQSQSALGTDFKSVPSLGANRKAGEVKTSITAARGYTSTGSRRNRMIVLTSGSWIKGSPTGQAKGIRLSSKTRRRVGR